MNSRVKAALVPVLAVLVFALVAGYTLLVVPVGEGPEESAHVARAVRVLFNSGDAPDSGVNAGATIPHEPPLYYELGAAAIRLFGLDRAELAGGGSTTVRRPVRLPGPYRTDLTYCRLPGGREPVLSPAYPVRFVSLLFGLLLVVGLYAGAAWAFEGRRRLMAASVGWALLPGVVLSAAVAANDVAAAALSTLVYALYMRTLAGRYLTRRWHGLALGVLLGAAALTKLSGIIPALLLPIAVGQAAMRSGARREAMVGGVVALAAFLLVLVASPLLAPGPEGSAPPSEAMPPPAAASVPMSLPVGADYLGHVFTRVVHGYLGELGDQDVGLSRPLLLLFLLIGGAAAGGIILLLRDRWRASRAAPAPDASAAREHFVLSDDPRLMLAHPGPDLPAPHGADEAVDEPTVEPILGSGAVLFCAIAIAVTLAFVLIRSFVVPEPEVRGLQVAVLPVTLLGVAGIHRLVGGEGFKVAAPILALGPLLASVYTVLFGVLPHFHTPWSKWTRGEVIHYDDGGHPRAEPHLVRGSGEVGDFEPWGTYSKARVPAMNVAWGAPEVVFRYEGLDPRLPYQARVTYYGGREPAKFGLVTYQELWAGRHRVHGPIPLTFQPRELSFPLPRGAVEASGRLELEFRAVRGGVAAVAEVWIERAWVSLKALDSTPKPPRAGERVQVRFGLANRDQRAEHRAELYLFVGNGEGKIRALLGKETFKPLRAGQPWSGGLVANLPDDARGHGLLVGVRRPDRGPWAILKGATHLGPGGVKRGDLDARDLHVAVVKPGGEADGEAIVMRAPIESLPSGSIRVLLRYRAGGEGTLRALSGSGAALGRMTLPSTGGAYREEVGKIAVRGATVAVIEVAFAGTDPAAVDEVQVWAEGGRAGFHLYAVDRIR
jgi:hypothetical protein